MRFLDRGAWASNPMFPSAEGGEFFSHNQLQTTTIEALRNYIRRRIGGYAVSIKDSQQLIDCIAEEFVANAP
jgi:hypothetical protein